jgi:hypothetical protein
MTHINIKMKTLDEQTLDFSGEVFIPQEIREALSDNIRDYYESQV